MKTVAVSGGFDPIHIGHVRMLQEARALGDRLVVILNNESWLRAKKGFVFMPDEERAEIIRAFPYVDDVVITSHVENDPDRSVCRELASIKPDIFANGGDRKNEADIPETVVCRQYNIEMIFNIGHGGKVQSSSWLTSSAAKQVGTEVRPWGRFRVLAAEKKYWVKTLEVKPGQRLSLQSHKKREEVWLCVKGTVMAEKGKLKRGRAVVEEKKTLKEGDMFVVPLGAVHRLSSKKGGMIVEVAYGAPIEKDIVRYEDDYARV